MAHRSIRREADRPRSIPCLVTAPAMVCLIAALACGTSGDGDDGTDTQAPLRPHVLLLTVDTLRADHTSLHGYVRETTPELERAAEEGTVFERAIAQWPKTGTSFASMFMGRYPQSTGLTHRASLRVPDVLGILPEAFQDNGYRTLAVVSNPVLSVELGWDRGFDEYLPTWSDSMSDEPTEYRRELSAQRVNLLAREILERHGYTEDTAARQPPLFLWLHYTDPHAPYYLAEGEEDPFTGDDLYEAAGDATVDLTGTRGRAIAGLSQVRDYVAHYDANVRVTDRHLGEILAHLSALGVRQDAWTIVTADHGESLDEHGLYFEHGPLPYNTTAHVPLLMVPPRGSFEAARGRRVTEPVELIDLAPTLVDLVLPGLGLEGGFRGRAPAEETLAALTVAEDPGSPETAPAGETATPADDCVGFDLDALREDLLDPTFEGRSLAPMLSGRASGPPGEAFAFSEAGRAGRRQYRSVQGPRYKLVFRETGGDRRPGPQDFELYDLLTDPLETENRLARLPDQVRPLRAELLAFADRANPSMTENRQPCSQREREILEKMGYL